MQFALQVLPVADTKAHLPLLEYHKPMKAIPLGLREEMRILVSPEVAINFMDCEEARVLSTPWLIAYMEITARNAILPHLDEGYDSVGTIVNIRHLAATPIGMQARFVAEVVEVNDRRVLFRVEAWDEREKIGEGTHERFIVNVQRFGARLQEKLGR
jgi:fluoroacetyl-CoA thioesterase